MKTNYIEGLKLKNFTAFDEIEFKFSPGINVLIGANSTGKTHVLKALYSFLRVYRDWGRKGDREFGIEDQKDLFFSMRNMLEANYLPDGFNLGRLIRRNTDIASATITIDFGGIETNFDIIMKSGATRAPGLPTDIKVERSTVFIPTKEILTNAKDLMGLFDTRETETYEGIYKNITRNAYKIPIKDKKEPFKIILKDIESIIGGEIITKDFKFYLKTGDDLLEFTLLAEGFSKLALLWVLINNGSIEPGSTLLWDEPESNLNPKMLREVVIVLLELQRHNVQIFLATHNYVLLKEFDLQMKEKDSVMFHSLYKEDETIKVSLTDDYYNIEPNVISETYLDIYERDVRRTFVSEDGE